MKNVYYVVGKQSDSRCRWVFPTEQKATDFIEYCKNNGDSLAVVTGDYFIDGPCWSMKSPESDERP